MHDFRFAHTQKYWPKPARAERVDTGFERLGESLARLEDADQRSCVQAALEDRAVRACLTGLFGNSPYLTDSVLKEPAFACRLLDAGPDAVLPDVFRSLDDSPRTPAGDSGQTDRALARELRIAKRRLSLAVALADIAGAWPLEKITQTLSDFADTALQTSVRHLLRAAADKNVITITDAAEPEKESGYIVLALGKLGSHALNYSSDIDLIVFYDPDKVRSEKPDQLQKFYIRLTQNLVKLMEERTADGYVFRTDLRLRPDPGATPIAVSVEAAEIYYESLGQNWERAAMIKARPVAGDLTLGQAFVDNLKPFVWRRNLDFAAIQDIHSIKRQINAHRGGHAIALGGHNVKLGRGGIREIEFFIQTQQLIWGGRVPALQVSGTGDALQALVDLGQVSAETAGDLIEAYRFLRRVEHRLQMINDEQTHTLPKDERGLNDVAVFLGYDDTASFADDLLGHLRNVERHYAELFEDAPTLSAQGEFAGNLVFTGVDPDPDTLETIRSLGFEKPEIVDNCVRGWHHGRYRATRSTRARELLTELMPVLLTALAKTTQPDAAFLRFHEFLSHLPAGVQLFSMFHSNPQLLTLVAEIMGGAPRLAEHLSQRPSTLDSVLTNGFFEPPPELDTLTRELGGLLDRVGAIEEFLDTARRWANDRRFQIGVQMLQGFLKPPEASRVTSDIADAAISELYPRITAEFVARHGHVGGSEIAILALGKLGGREMTATSDLDLIVVYDAPPAAEASDGAKPLAVPQYFSRLSQRMINALTAQTAEGVLFEVDMRLRPSGAAGPIASSLDAFIRYHDETAWTWEHMALTRARVVLATGTLKDRIEETIRATLCKRRDPNGLLADVASMRARIDKEHHTDCLWSIKHFRGGLVDVEFLAQYFQLEYAHDRPEILSVNTREALSNLIAAELIARENGDVLIAALDLWQAVQGMLRLTLEGEVAKISQSDFPAELQKALAAYCGAADFNTLQATITRRAQAVYDIFTRMIEEPAAALEPAADDTATAKASGQIRP
ncbi:MAG: bifunctional [glutamine synthetase] adenylyltransferase/[glutamine synthetase]-adenylyl-L-tyrosine phosphorylase [Rhodospirillales bacterium]